MNSPKEDQLAQQQESNNEPLPSLKDLASELVYMLSAANAHSCSDDDDDDSQLNRSILQYYSQDSQSKDDRLFADVPSQSITSIDELDISCSSRRSKHSNILAPFDDDDSAGLFKEDTVGDTISSIISDISFSRTVRKKGGSRNTSSRSNSFTGEDASELVASLKKYDSSPPTMDHRFTGPICPWRP
jgi:hypothetical protein